MPFALLKFIDFESSYFGATFNSVWISFYGSIPFKGQAIATS